MRHTFLPALLSSIVADGIAPFITFVIGQAFGVFAQFFLTLEPPIQSKEDCWLSHGEIYKVRLPFLTF